MSGLKIVLPSAFTDTSLPVLRDDPVLTAGSLLLVDPAHAANPWAAGVPADGALVPNVAWKEAVATIGSGTQSTLQALFKSSGVTGATGLVERSSKGGLHVILSATATLSVGVGVTIRPPTPVLDWMIANPNHSYFFSLWYKGTRFGNANASSALISLGASQSTSELFYSLGSGGTNPSGGKNVGQRRSRTFYMPASDSALTPPYQEEVIMNVGVSGYTGTPAVTSATAQANSKLFGAGRVGFFGESSTLPSKLFRRAYIEDLTVSGRTYAQVDALDFAEYTTQVNTVGGRYYGDTYTAASTIA